MISSQFCPWASRSARLKRLRYVDAPALTPAEAALWVEKEAQQLAAQSAQALSSTVVVFGHVGLWRDFDVFDAYVRAPGQWVEKQRSAESWDRGRAPKGTRHGRSLEAVAARPFQCRLVAFHPYFQRWLWPERRNGSASAEDEAISMDPRHCTYRLHAEASTGSPLSRPYHFSEGLLMPFG